MDLTLYFRVSVVEAMWFLSATCGPFLSKALKDSLGTVYVFASKKLYLLLTVLYKDNNKERNFVLDLVTFIFNISTANQTSWRDYF